MVKIEKYTNGKKIHRNNPLNNRYANYIFALGKQVFIDPIIIAAIIIAPTIQIPKDNKFPAIWHENVLLLHVKKFGINDNQV